MKKSIIFAAGFALVTSAMIPFSSASRMAYHAYITAQENRATYRYHAESRRAPQAKTPQEILRERRANARNERNSRRNYSQPRGAVENSSRDRATNTTYVEATSRTSVDRQIRPFATRAGIAPWRQNLRGTGRYARVSSAKLPNQMMSFETFENNTFSVELPAGAQAKANDAHAFVSGDADIRIKRFDAGTCHQSFGFRGCAANITRSENSALVGGEGRLISLDRVIRQMYKSDTILQQVNLQTDVYTEEFVAQFPDGGTYTLYRFAAQDTDGGVYFIEVKVPRDQSQAYVAVADRIFDSFRIYTTK